MPLSGGPSLILASCPMSWQGEHNRLNTCSPAAASCATVVPVEAVSAIPAITHILIHFFPLRRITGDSLIYSIMHAVPAPPDDKPRPPLWALLRSGLMPIVTPVTPTRRAPSPQIGARDTALDAAANCSEHPRRGRRD